MTTRPFRQIRPDIAQLLGSCDFVDRLHRFDYELIPQNVAKPILRGAIMLPLAPALDDIWEALEPHLGSECQLDRITYGRRTRDMVSVADARQPENVRATAVLYRDRRYDGGCIHGDAVLFERRVLAVGSGSF